MKILKLRCKNQPSSKRRMRRRITRRKAEREMRVFYRNHGHLYFSELPEVEYFEAR